MASDAPAMEQGARVGIGMAPMCVFCRHLDRGSIKGGARGKGLTCAAFPGGVPLEIVQFRADHRQPFAGDGGKRFAALDLGAEVEVAQRWELVKARAAELQALADRYGGTVVDSGGGPAQS